MSLFRTRRVTAEDMFLEYLHSLVLSDQGRSDMAVNYMLNTMTPIYWNRFVVDICTQNVLKCYYAKGNKKQGTTKATPTF